MHRDDLLFEGRCFSPAAETQREKRIHRIGQTQPCFIGHLVASGSVGYAIGKIHKDKAALAKTILKRRSFRGRAGATEF